MYSDIEDQIRERNHSLSLIEEGFRYFTIGLASKMLIANVMGSLWTEAKMVGFASLSTPMAWISMFAFSFQIYFDFQGYSLMAIGLGKMMGFKIPQNFNHPYTARSVGEFWRRWHITLGTWFREYVYIPLGGSRVSKGRMIFNLFVVWMLTGFWHGAGWNFILWGLSLFVLITFEKVFLLKYLDRYRVLSHLYLLVVIPMSWMLFAIDSLKDIGVYFQRLLPFLGHIQSDYIQQTDFIQVLSRYGFFFVAAIFFCTGLQKFLGKLKMQRLVAWPMLVVFWVCVWQMITATNNPFLYFRF